MAKEKTENLQKDDKLYFVIKRRDIEGSVFGTDKGLTWDSPSVDVHKAFSELTGIERDGRRTSAKKELAAELGIERAEDMTPVQLMDAARKKVEEMKEQAKAKPSKK